MQTLESLDQALSAIDLDEADGLTRFARGLELRALRIADLSAAVRVSPDLELKQRLEASAAAGEQLFSRLVEHRRGLTAGFHRAHLVSLWE